MGSSWLFAAKAAPSDARQVFDLPTTLTIKPSGLRPLQPLQLGSTVRQVGALPRIGRRSLSAHS